MPRSPIEEVEFHSMDEIRAYIRKEIERQIALEQKKVERWRLAKQGIWLLLLVVAYLQYFLIDIIYETITLPSLGVSVHVPNNATRNPPKLRT